MTSTSTTDPEHHNRLLIGVAIIGAVATLLASLGGLVFSGLASLQATEQARLAQEAQTSERFSRSVEQLGSDSIAVRIGAVYSFDRLMRDSEPDQQAIVEILSTFVRLQGNAVPPPEGQEARTVPVDFLAAIKVLDDFGANAARSDSLATMLLSKVNLSGFSLRSIAMRGADMTLADLSGADLINADLRGVDLAFADLSGALLTGADLTNADLTNADLTGADLNDAVLQGADLTDAVLQGAHLNDADLTNADLTNADLANVICSAATKWPDGFTSAPQCK